MKIQVLRSSSYNNATVIWDDTSALMVDCGVGPRTLKKKLADIGLEINALSGALITHTDGDHMNDAVIRRLTMEGVPIYCHADIKKIAVRMTTAELKRKVSRNIKPFTTLRQFMVGGFKIKPFRVSHDSVGGCFGYCISIRTGSEKRKITLGTDFGCPTNKVLKQFENSDAILICSDHDNIMLQDNYEIPEYVKHDHIIPYHLSNDECAEVLSRVLNKSTKLPKAIFLLHISDKINTAEKAVAKCKAVLRKNGFGKIPVLPAYKMDASEIVEV